MNWVGNSFVQRCDEINVSGLKLHYSLSQLEFVCNESYLLRLFVWCKWIIIIPSLLLCKSCVKLLSAKWRKWDSAHPKIFTDFIRFILHKNRFMCHRSLCGTKLSYNQVSPPSAKAVGVLCVGVLVREFWRWKMRICALIKLQINQLEWKMSVRYRVMYLGMKWNLQIRPFVRLIRWSSSHLRC